MAEINPVGYVTGGAYSARQDMIYITSLLAAEQSVSQPLKKRAGVLPYSFLVNNVSGWNAGIGDGLGFVPALDGRGSHICFAEGVTNVPVTPADPSLARIDLIVARVDPDGNDPTLWRLRSLTGTPGSGSPPAVPAQAVPLWEVRLPAGTGSLSTGYFFPRRRFTAAQGGVVTLAEGEAFPTAPYGGMIVYRRDDGTAHMWADTTTAWLPLSHGATSWAQTTRITDASLSTAGAEVRILFGSAVDVLTTDTVRVDCSWRGFAWAASGSAHEQVTLRLRRGDLPNGAILSTVDVAVAPGTTSGGGSLWVIDESPGVNQQYLLTASRRLSSAGTVVLASAGTNEATRMLVERRRIA